MYSDTWPDGIYPPFLTEGMPTKMRNGNYTPWKVKAQMLHGCFLQLESGNYVQSLWWPILYIYSKPGLGKLPLGLAIPKIDSCSLKILE